MPEVGRGDLTHAAWARFEPCFRLRTGAPWRDLPSQYGPWKTVCERHRRWSADGTWDKILRSLLAHADAEDRIDWSVVSIDSTSCRAHQHAVGAPRHPRASRGARLCLLSIDPMKGWLGRSRGGLTSKIDLVGEGGRRPLAFLITLGQWGDAPQLIPVLERLRVPRLTTGRPRTRTDHLSGDKAYSSRRNRRYLRRRQIKHTIAEPRSQRASRQRRGRRGGRPVGFDKAIYKRRNEVERTINALENFRAVATRYDKRAYVFHGTVTLAMIRLWLRP
ncbi:IS5 family transposase [Streptomyces sp. NPDC055092]